MTSASRFNAQVVAGDETAIAINEVVEGLGFIVEHNSSAPNALRAVAALEYAYHGAKVGKGAKNRHDSELLAATLETIRAAWPKLPDTAKSALTIRGLSYFLAKTDNVDHERLAKQLSKITPSALAKRAEALREGHGQSGNSPSYMADAIESQYRKR